MRGGWMFVGGIGIGAALMYALDPDRGNRRRALARDKVRLASNKTGMYLGKLSRDLRNRGIGLVAETTACIRDWAGKPRGGEATDERLIERVKSNLGRYSVHDRALDITAHEGRVTLRGPALAGEVDEIVKAVSAVRGVVEVDNQLDVHQEAGSISSLQGEPVAPPSGGRW